jgi:hypothetical protein
MDVYVSQKCDAQNIQNDIQDGNEDNFEIDHIVEKTTYPFSNILGYSL